MDEQSIIARAGLPIMEGHVASILNEKLLAGMYAKYLSKIGVVLMDI
ncbi:MAG: hypothetical protein GXO43_08320, partial [Crenarchaeota archaeon]|nr:hypothetical protein [Thermoproteota archaeon]